MTVFFRLLEADDKAAALLGAIRESDKVRGRYRFDVEPASFAAVPRSPFAYWASPRIRALFSSNEPFETSGRAARHGASTLDNFRFLKLFWEVKNDESKWRPYAKGGEYSPFYDDVRLVLNWFDEGREVKAYVEAKVGSASRTIQATEFYFRPGLTWPSRTQSGFAPRALPAGCIFDCKGNAAFVPGDTPEDILAFLAMFLSSSFRTLVNLQMSFGSYDVGVVQRTPICPMSRDAREGLVRLAYRAWSLKRRLDSSTETSHAFDRPALLQIEGETITERAAAWVQHVGTIEAELSSIHIAIDDKCFNLYGIDEADRRAIMQGFGGGAEVLDEGAETDADDDNDNDDEDAARSDASISTLAADLISWGVGVAFGRFDLRLASRTTPLPPGPFEPLPVGSPALLIDHDGLPIRSAPENYPIAFAENGILVDDAGHRNDLTASVRAVFDSVFGASAEASWNEVAALLDPNDQDMRSWLASSFFEHHLKRYSNSRRKAPILWQLSTPSGRYSVWLYAPRLTRDTLFQLQNEVVAAKVAHEERQLTRLVHAFGASPSAKERKEIAAQAEFVEDLRALLDDVKRVTPLWNPSLDDGVVLTMAPLWRLVPHHKPWQRELKCKWDDLVGAKYDWAHLAMHLWPDRVVPKCAADRSLAIAHGLEDVFWVEDPVGKWKPRATPARPVTEIVRERTSAAVKAALKGFLEAPTTTTGGARGRGRRTASVATG